MKPDRIENSLTLTLEIIRFAAADVIATSEAEPTPTPPGIPLPIDMFD